MTPNPEERKAKSLDEKAFRLIHEYLNSYCPHRDLERSLSKPITPNAKAIDPVLSLTDLRKIISCYPGSTVVISDVHGYKSLLKGVLEELGVVKGKNRIGPKVQLLSIGDLVDGRRGSGDLATLKYGLTVFDLIIAGNHETAFMGGPTFEGQPEDWPRGLKRELLKAANAGKIVPFMLVDNVLISHAGVNSELFRNTSRSKTIQRLELEWRGFLSQNGKFFPFDLGEYEDPLFAISPKREGTCKHGGGLLWEDWSHLVNHHSQEFRQIVGHSARGRMECSLSGNLFNIDVAGYRLGVAVITPKGEIHFGSDYLDFDKLNP